MFLFSDPDYRSVNSHHPESSQRKFHIAAIASSSYAQDLLSSVDPLAPENASLNEILRTVERSAELFLNRLNPISPVLMKPLTPNVTPNYVVAVSPNRVNMMTSRRRISFHSIKMRNPRAVTIHESLITTLRFKLIARPRKSKCSENLPRRQTKNIVL